MSLDPRTPVLIGAGTATQRFDDPLEGLDPIGLLVEAARSAATDAGCPDALADLDVIYAMQGTWPMADPARVLAQCIGATEARTVRADMGILQTTVFGRAAEAISAGEADLVLIGGSEAKWRELRARIAGVALPPTTGQQDAASGIEELPPDDQWSPHGHIISPREIGLGLIQAVHHYSMIENARRTLDGQSLAEHQHSIDAGWAAWNIVARDNVDAWNRQVMSPDDIRATGPRNKPIAFPYNKWHVSQMNVDQAAALLMCSVETAQRLGVAPDRWLFPQVVADSEHMVPVSERATIARSPGFALAGAAAFGHAGIGLDDIAHIELYSCFPIAVRTQMLEFGIAAGRQVTCTGGMTWAGGPLNSAVIQQMPTMVRVLREDAGSVGMINAISGMITKQGVSLWSTTPPARPFARHDVSGSAAAHTGRIETRDTTDEEAAIVTSTVLYDSAGQPERVVAVCDLDSGQRGLVASADASLTDAFVREDWNGRRVRLGDGNRLLG
jgi:acetyl-CoA C-acetyltransferase